MFYTIGYSNRQAEELFFEIESRNIVELVDVRSSPRSRIPAYNGRRLEQWCADAGITYRHEGWVLGGRSEVSLMIYPMWRRSSVSSTYRAYQTLP